LAIDLLSTPINIAKLVTTSKNDSSVIERREVSLELEEKIYSITKGASSSAYFNYFKNMASTNIQNASFEKWIGEGGKDQVKGNHVRRNRDFSKEIIW